MRTGYYERETEIRFTEGILAKSRDWQWLVDETAKTFETPEWGNGTFDGFRRVFHGVACAYGHLSSIADIWPDLQFSFLCEWERRIWESCLIRAGASELPDEPTGNAFFDLLDVVSYSTRLLNSVSDRKLTYDLGLFSLGNYQDLFRLDDLVDEGERIVSRLREIDAGGLGPTIAIVKGNFEGKRVECDEETINKVLDNEFDADFLDFKAPDDVVCRTWQEAYLLDCLRASYQGDELMSLVGFREGGSIPDFSLMTESVLANMRKNLNDPRARCVVDSTAYLLHETRVPQESIDLLIDLTLERIEDVSTGAREPYELSCTSVGLCARMVARNELPNENKPTLIGGISRITGSVKDPDILAVIERMGFPLGKKQKQLLADAKRRKCFRIDSINDPNELVHYMKDEDVSRFCSQPCAERTMHKFAALVGRAGDKTVLLFIAAMNFFIGLLNNKGIDNRWAKSCLINIQLNWSESFYTKVVAGMPTFTRELSIPADQNEELSAAVLKNPLLFGHWTIRLSEKEIEERIETISETALLAKVPRATIDEYIPHNERFDVSSARQHSIDAMILNEISHVNEKYSYRYLNQLEAEEVASRWYAEKARDVRLMASMLSVIPDMYESIRTHISSRYDLIGYPLEGRVTLAHVSQLFPVMENTIRELGAHFWITPFRARRDEFHILKDAPQVLGELLDFVREATGTIAGAEDLVFVHFAMFSKNGLNIRNACIHGQGYQRGAQLEEAFRLTVICEYMLLYRLGMVIRVEEASDPETERGGRPASGSASPGGSAKDA